MSDKASTFRLGLFILGGSALLLLTVVVLGAGSFFSKQYLMETYLNESVNGLDVGSAVKFRGVKVGSVTRIGFVTEKYTDFFNSRYRYVLVECALDAEHFKQVDSAALAAGIKNEIERGLRVRPISQGLTGQIFLGIDYVDPLSNPPLAIDWEPQHLYIPAAPSTISRIELAVTNIGNALSALNKEDMEAIIRDVRLITKSLSEFVQKGDKEGLGKQLARTMDGVNKALERVNALLGRPELDRFIVGAAGAAEGLNRLVERSGDDIAVTAANMRSTSQVLAGVLEENRLRTGFDQLGKALHNVGKSSDELRSTMGKVNAVAGRINALVAGQQANFQVIVEDLRALVENLKELSGEAKRNPSGMIFGQPPQRVQP